MVNIVHYIANGTAPLPVKVKVEKLNPMVKVIYYGTIMLKGTGDEQTAVRFTMKGQEISNVNNRPKSLVELARSEGSKGGANGDAGAAPQPSGMIDATTGQVIK